MKNQPPKKYLLEGEIEEIRGERNEEANGGKYPIVFILRTFLRLEK